MKRYLTILFLGMMVTNSLYGMTESVDAKKVQQVAGTEVVNGTDEKEIDPKQLCKDYAELFVVTELAQRSGEESIDVVVAYLAKNEIGFKPICDGIQEIKQVCEQGPKNSFAYAFMTNERKKDWKGDDKIFVGVYGVKFAEYVQTIVCSVRKIKDEKFLKALVNADSDNPEYEIYQEVVAPHMLAFVNEIIALLDQNKSSKK